MQVKEHDTGGPNIHIKNLVGYATNIERGSSKIIEERVQREKIKETKLIGMTYCNILNPETEWKNMVT